MKINDLEYEQYEDKELMSLLFRQSLAGIFFMMLDDPIIWNDHTDKEKTLDYVFEHQKITMINQAMLDQYSADESQMMGATPNELFTHDIDQGRRTWMQLFDQGHLYIDTEEKKLDGSKMYVQGDYICLYDNQNRIIGHFGIQMDITAKRKAEPALKESVIVRENSEELERFFSVNPDLMIITDHEANIIKVNPAWEIVFGYTIEELKQHKYLDFIHPDDISKTVEAMEGLSKQERQLAVVNRYLCSNGDYRYLEWHAHSFGDTVYGTARDITEKVKTEEFLVKEKELFNATLNTIGVGIIVTDSSGRILLMNPMAETLTGWTNDEAFMKEFGTFFTTINLKTRETLQSVVDIVLKTGMSLNSRKGAGIITKMGTEIYVEGVSTPILSGNGTVNGVVVSFRDMTKEYSLEKEMEGFLNVNLDILCVLDRDGIIHRANKKFEEVLGYSADEIQGKNVKEFLNQEGTEQVNALKHSMDKEGSISNFIVKLRCKNGSYKFIEWNMLPGTENFIYASARDITQKILHEKKLTEQATKDELTGIYNRHYCDLIIGDLMDQADNAGEPLSFLLIDFDHFKLVNDTWGHPVGDDLLKFTSSLLHKKLREKDVLIRMGGEEFAVILPQTNLAGAQVAAEKLRQAVEKSRHSIAGSITISIGASERMKAESFRHFYRRSDEALYAAKQNGRNRVVLSDDAEYSPSAYLHLDWRKDWESGNKTIDQQHKELIDSANQAINRMLEGADDKRLLHYMDEEILHIKKHFETEEKILSELSYPGFAEYKDIHMQLIQKVLKLKASLEKGEIRFSALLSFILDEIIQDHLILEDTKFFDFLKKRR